jgi:hypothetical protein
MLQPDNRHGSMSYVAAARTMQSAGKADETDTQLI